MSIETRLFQPDDLEHWDRFVGQANNGTIFHERRFLSYHPTDRFHDHSLILEKKGKTIALFPAALRKEKEGKALVSHPGSSYGGLVVGRDLSIRDSYDIVEALIRYTRSEGLHKIKMTLPPAIYQSRVSNYLDFSLIKHGFQYVKRDVSSMLTIEPSPEENLALFRTSHRTAVRKAIKQGVTINESDDWRSFYSILKTNLKIRHGVNPTHTLDEIIKLKTLYPERIKLFSAFLGKKMVAGVVNFSVNQDVVLAFYISHDEAHQKLRAVNLLFYEIIKWCQANNFKYLDFGIFTVDMDPNFGLGRFKENFGASGVFRDTFEREL
ncbi:MAG: GNAT family N-acetyltransferase [Candidatus Marinimicrobia bacterium]|nr:GNAT family N-acetyltransferase [Candidatus Neomarinimicrobiota bacterium]MCF7903860.1 GNAT family N-acetyltransferase [Candidatus Neomarinimicrobiota bacterium]